MFSKFLEIDYLYMLVSLFSKNVLSFLMDFFSGNCKYHMNSQISLSFCRVNPHIIQPELTVPGHKKVKLSDILHLYICVM